MRIVLFYHSIARFGFSPATRIFEAAGAAACVITDAWEGIGLARTLLEPARRWPDGRFAVVGPQYPAAIPWPPNVDRADHLPPARHAAFYNAQRFTLNVTRRDMIRAGYCPSVRLFEAAACGVPILTDAWSGLATFFEPGSEILVVSSAAEVLACLRDWPDAQRTALGQRASRRILAAHTAAHRARELEAWVDECRPAVRPRRAARAGPVAPSGRGRRA